MVGKLNWMSLHFQTLFVSKFHNTESGLLLGDCPGASACVLDSPFLCTDVNRRE